MNKKIRYLLAAILAALVYLQSELGLDHTWHVIIGVAIVVLAAFGINKGENSNAL